MRRWEFRVEVKLHKSDLVLIDIHVHALFRVVKELAKILPEDKLSLIVFLSAEEGRILSFTFAVSDILVCESFHRLQLLVGEPELSLQCNFP